MTALIRPIGLVLIIALAGCSAGTSAVSPPLSPTLAAAAAAHRSASDASADSATATALPGTATGLPGTATGLPGTATGLPGTATALPGAQFSCAPMPQSGSASCTIAININVPPMRDPSAPISSIVGYHPADLQAAYGLPSNAAGGTVAIVDAYDAPSAEADLAVYRAAFGLAPCTTSNGCFRKVNQRGAATPPTANAAWAQEIALDLDMVSAACPRCTIVLVEADSSSMDDLGASVDTAARLGAMAISNSYYAAEWNGEGAEDVHYRHPGIAITASSGDRPQTAYPAASTYVTSVGGTTLNRNGGGWSESPWAYGGRGCSAYIGKPLWQSIAPCATRSAVDVAMVADPQTGVSMFDSGSGGWLVAGGTSVGAPLVAAAYALSQHPAGPDYSYSRLNAFRAIGTAGYALETGLGSPNGVAGL